MSLKCFYINNNNRRQPALVKRLEERLALSKFYKTTLWNIAIPKWAVDELYLFDEMVGYTPARAKTLCAWIKYDRRDWVALWAQKEKLYNGTLEFHHLMYGIAEGNSRYLSLNTRKTAKFDHTSATQRTRANINADKIRGKTGVTGRSPQFWIGKGFSAEEAQAKVKAIQATNTIEAYVMKYGEVDGKTRFNNRIKQWTITMSSEKIGRKRSLGLWRYIERHGEEEGRKKYIAMRKKRNVTFEFGKASKESLIAFSPILKYCDENKLDYFVGVEGNKEWFISNESKTYFYDLTIPSLSVIIEYNGTAFHPSNALTNTELNEWKQLFTNKSSREVLAEDSHKKDIAIRNGWDIHYIYADNVEADIEKLRNHINF